MCHRFISVLLISLVILSGSFLCDEYSNSTHGSRGHDLFEHLKHHMRTEERENTSATVTWANGSEYLPYFSGIIKTVLHTTWDTNKVNLFTHLDCSSELTSKLLSTFLKYQVTVNCYQQEQFDVYVIEELLRNNFGDAAILLLPWYHTEDLLIRFAHLGIDESPYITLEISQPLIRRLKTINSHLKVSNIITVKSEEPDCETVTPLNFLLMKKLDILERQHRQVMICNSLKIKPLMISTVIYGKDILMDLVPNVYPIHNVCTIGLPCRKKDMTGWTWYCCHGIYMDFVQLIVNHLKTDFEIYICEDNQFGSKVNGEWNGMVKDIILGEADLGAHFFNVLPTRLHVVDFTSSVSKTTDGFGLIKRKFDKKYLPINWTFISSIDNDLLLVSFGIAFIIGLTLIFLETVILSRLEGKRYATREGMSHVSGLLLQRDLGGTVSRTWSGQTLSTFFAFGMAVLISSYTAKLTASGITKEVDTFQVFKDPSLKNPSYKVAMRKGTANFIYYNKLKGLKAEQVYVDKTPFQRLINGEIDYYVCSPYYTQIIINKNKEYFEQLKVYNDETYQMDYAFAYKKGSVIGQKISNYLLFMKEVGIMADIIDRWMIKKNDPAVMHHFPWEYAGGMILVLGITAGVCVIILLAENVYTYMKQKRNSTARTAKVNNGTNRDNPCFSQINF